MGGLPTTESLFRRSFSVLASGFGPFVTLAFVVQLPVLGLNLLLIVGEVSNRSEPDAEPSLVTCFVVAGGSVFLIFLILLLTTMATAVMVYGVFEILRGRPLRLVDCVHVVAGRWLAVIGLAVLVGLSELGSYLLCLIPGVIVSCGLFAAVPALLVERLQVTDAMRRSWSLTDGYKGIIFFVVLGIGGVQIATAWGSQWLLEWSAENAWTAGLLLSALLDYLVTVALASFQAVAVGVAYHDLRVFREGLDEQELAAVFG